MRLVITDKALSSTSSPIISLNIDIDGTVRDSLAHKITDEDLRGIIDATLKAKGRLHLKAVSGRVTLDVLLGFIRRVESLDKSSSTFPIFLHLK